jgi:3-hydroxybutyryl-CoA dehydrogenase
MKQIIGVLGAGTMGAGIAQVAAQNGNQVILVDVNQSQLDLAKSNLSLILSKLILKTKQPKKFPKKCLLERWRILE